MKYLLFCLIIGLLIGIGPTQGTKDNMGYKITYETRLEPQSDASAKDREEAKTFNNKQSTINLFLSNDLYYLQRKEEKGTYGIIFNGRDSIVYEYNTSSEIANKYDLLTYFNKDISTSSMDTIRQKHFPGNNKTLAGYKTHKSVFTTVNTHTKDTVNHKVWRTDELPNWVGKEFDNRFKIDLKHTTVYLSSNQHLKLVITAKNIERKPIPDSLYMPPKGIEIQPNDETEDHFYDEKRGNNNPDQKEKDSLISVLDSLAHKKTYEAGARFTNGLARIQKEDTSYYINKGGLKVFETIESDYQPIDTIRPGSQPGYIHIERKDFRCYIVKQEGKFGVFNPRKQDWMILPKYEDIQLDFKKYLLLKKDKKFGYADTWGNILVPPKFDEVKIMDDQYFDVRKGEYWSVYDAKAQETIFPFDYDEFDYCGGCGGGADYAYASKNGEWGVLSFTDSVLVPFEYEHPGHHNMRSDRWVTSFEKNGQNVIINMKIDSAYSEKDYEAMKVINGALALKKEGKYGLIDKEGRQVVDFKYGSMVDPYGSFSWGPLIKVYQNKQIGLIDNKGKTILPVGKYEGFSLSGDYYVVYQNDKAGILDSMTHEILPVKYDRIDGQFPKVVKNSSGGQERLYRIEKDDKKGLYNVDRDTVLPPKYTGIDFVMVPDSIQHYIEVDQKVGDGYKDHRYGLYDLDMNELMPPHYQRYYLIDTGLVELIQNQNYGLYDLEDHKEVVPPEYDAFRQISDRFYRFSNRDDSYKSTYFIWDRKTKKFIDLPYEHINTGAPKNGNVIIAGDDENTVLYDLETQKVLAQYPIRKFGNDHTSPTIKSFSHGVAFFYKHDKMGLLNAEGEEIIPAKYDEAKRLGRFIRFSTKQGEDMMADIYTDTTGTRLNPEPYERSSRRYGILLSSKEINGALQIVAYDKTTGENKIGLIDKQGEEIIPPKFDQIIPLGPNKGFVVGDNQNFGIYNEQGQELLPPILDNVMIPGSSLNMTDAEAEFPLLCVMDNHYFYMTASGDILTLIMDNTFAFRVNTQRY